jgi:hypothetical protein
LLGLVAHNIVLIVSMKGYYMWRNSTREKVWGRMSERGEYLATTTDKGNKRCATTAFVSKRTVQKTTNQDAD